MTLKAPFPWFGGKSRVADYVWQRFGNVDNYVEPFAGSLAVLLGRPHEPKIETVNDLDGFIANAWRAIAADPELVAHYADWPVNENDLHARHVWLLKQRDTLVPRLEGDPDYYDAKIAGWWLWGIAGWIGSGWCSGNGPWWPNEDELLVNGSTQGVWRTRPHLGNQGRGVNRKLPHLGDQGQGVNRKHDGLVDYMNALADRLRGVRVCCGDWTRVCGPSVTHKHGLTGVFLDPPYSAEDRDSVYAEESFTVALDVRKWCHENGDNPLMRIALCGYSGEGHETLEEAGWTRLNWKTAGGYSKDGSRGEANSNREAIWFSPHCLSPDQGTLF